MESLKRIIKGKQNKPAIDDYLTKQRESLNLDLEQMLQKLKAKSVIVNLSSLPKDKPINGFCVNRNQLPDARFKERITLEHTRGNSTQIPGLIINVSQNDVKIKLDTPLTIASSTNEVDLEYKIKFCNLELLKARSEIEKALNTFENSSCSKPIQNVILGKYKDLSNMEFTKARVVSMPNNKQLKGMQLVAAEQSMMKKISLIEGVAGSGKTLVAATIAYSMSRYRKRKILICSPMQSTVNKIVRLLSATEEAKVVKLPSVFQTKIEPDSSDEKSLVNLVNDAIYRKGRERLEESSVIVAGSLRQEVKFHKFASNLVENASPYLRRRMERDLLKSADIVCGTLLQAGNPILEGIKFDMLIIDDMQVASETDCLIPLMMKGLRQVTLLSDMRCEIRLARSNTLRRSARRNSMGVKRFSKMESNSCPNMLNYKIRKEDQLSYNCQRGSLFERWLSMGLAAVALKTQFRMHESVAAFPSHHFYLSRLKTDTATNEELTRQICNDLVLGEDRFNWLPNSKCLTAIFDKKPSQATIEVVRDIIYKLVTREKIDESRIGIITNNLTDTVQDFGTDIKVGSTEDFFGLEKDFIVLSYQDLEKFDKTTTLMNRDFVESDSALNIAVTRARLGLFIVADLSNLTTKKESTSETRILQTNYCKAWCYMISYYKRNGLIS